MDYDWDSHTDISSVDELQEDPESCTEGEAFWEEAEDQVLQTYEALAKGQIRVLHLLPGEEDEDVRCELVRVGLDETLQFEAVSYAWGTSDNLQRMILNGKSCMRRRNLLDCLRTLRRPSSRRVLWVDALSINQSDVEEKNLQVGLMPRIYSSASRTLIWIGQNGTYPYPQILARDDEAEYMLVDPKFSDALKLLKLLARNKHLHYTKDTLIRARGLEIITDQAWWSRAWVVQEALLSKSAHLALGKATIPWTTAYAGAWNFLTHVTTCCRGIQGDEYERAYVASMNRCMNCAAQVILSFQRALPGANNELLANLWLFRNRLATLEHDKVYGTLGLLLSDDVTLQPDYRKTFPELCREVILHDISVSGNLHALRGIRTTPPAHHYLDISDSESHTMSTWTTDWSDFNYWAEDQRRILTELYKPIYSASRTCRPRMSPPLDLCSSFAALHVAGKVVDRVAHASQVQSEFSTWLYTGNDEAWVSLLSTIKVFFSGGSSYIAGGSKLLALMKTLIGDCILPHMEHKNLFHNQRYSTDGSCALGIRRSSAKDLVAFQLWWLDYVAEMQREPKRFRRISAVMDIETSYQRATSGRRVIVTEKGYIGLGPEQKQEGDEVVVLLGGTTPFIVRKTRADDVEREKQWWLLGDCYVHGMMDGEMVEGERTEDWGMLGLI